jgi:structural maintenance of chromosome 1
MDVDEDEAGAQPVRSIPNFGIEVDFGGLEDEDREVSDHSA